MSEDVKEEYWKVLLRNHWLKLLPFVLVIIAAFISGIYVFLWHNEIGLGFGSFWVLTFNDWSFGLVFVYGFMLLLREFLLVGLPTIAVLGAIFGIMWYALSPEKREELKTLSKRGEEEEKKKRRKTGEGASGCAALVTIVFLILMAINGKWDVPFGTMDLQYFVITYLQAMIWAGIIFGIPILIGGIIYLVYKLK